MSEYLRLRKHQNEMLQIARSIKVEANIKRIYCDITPGGGKSGLPVILASELIKGSFDAICWITPRLSLQVQAERSFLSPVFRGILGHNHEIRISTNEFDPARQSSGFVTTYQAVQVGWNTLVQEFKRKRYILFLDEPHHIKQGGSWEYPVSRLIDLSELVVFASGTFQRGDKSPIAFIPYQQGENGLLEANFSEESNARVIKYSRRDALRENAIVPLHFPLFDGTTTYLNQDGQEVTINSLADEVDYSDALFSALQTDYAYQLLESCVNAWWDYKKHIFHKAKLLVVAPRIETAKKYKKFLQKRGIDCLIATSADSKEALTNIERYKGKQYPEVDVLITVAMAYEGLDVPPITHIACLTYIRSAPWLEQCFNRASRTYEGKTHGVIYGPDDYAFRAVIDQIRADQEAVAKELQPPRDIERSSTERQSIIPLNGQVTRQRMLDLEGDETDYQETQAILDAMKKHGVFGVSPLSVKAIMAEVGQVIKIKELNVTTDLSSPKLTLSQKEQKLRKAIEDHNRKFSYYNNLDPWHLNQIIKAEFLKPRDEMSYQELVRVWKWLQSNYPLRKDTYETANNS